KVNAWEERHCFSIDLRNSPMSGFKHKSVKDGWDVFLECTILDGDLSISMMTTPGITDDQFPVFKHLREITGSMLVFNVNGLTNLGRMFPNLRVIGGQSLIMNYALVIYQNEDLRYLGLDKLTVIRNGGVRIMDNAKLCYTRFINWDNILIGKIRDVMVDQSGGGVMFGETNQDMETCQDKFGCKVEHPERCQKVDGVLSCWNATTCQTLCRHHKGSNNTIGPGCSVTGERCHAACLGGCEVADDPGSCYACRDYELNGVCVDKCPPDMYEYMNNRCVTQAGCHRKLPVKSTLQDEKMLWKAFQGKCHYDCPDGYQEDPTNPRNCVICEGYCPRRCRGTTIDSIGEAMKYSKCNIIEGNLDISIQIGGQVAKAEKFTEALGNIREITGYLSVRFWPALTSLHMFKNLHVIHGEQLYNNRYALAVFEMENLRQLFSTEIEQNIQIKNGLVSFQNNPKLCYNRIMQFITHVGLEKNVTDNDISKYSNGEKAICEEVPLHVEVTSETNVFFVLSWKKFNTTDMDQRKFFGYLIYYKKVDKIDPKMQIDDDRSACADSWKMKFVPDDKDDSKENQTEWIENLDSNSIYAFYVQTKTVHHPGARNAISKIGFAKTLFSIPDMPRLKRHDAKGPDKIILEWDRPLKENGVITHYMVIWNAKSTANINQDPCGSIPKPSSSIPSTLVSHVSNAENTCPADKGCCKCNDIKETVKDKLLETPGSSDINAEDEDEKAKFENAVQNIVFVQHCAVSYDPLHCAGYIPEGHKSSSSPSTSPTQQAKRFRRHVKIRHKSPSSSSSASTQQAKRFRRHVKIRHRNSHRAIMHSFEQSAARFNLQIPQIKPNGSNGAAESEKPKTSKARTIRSILQAKQPLKANEIYDDEDSELQTWPTIHNDNVTSGRFNVTSTRIVITGLVHYTEYHIQVVACQDVTAPENYCSKQASSRFIRTDPIPDKDIIDKESINVHPYIVNGTENGDSRIISWDIPDDPNGALLGFRKPDFIKNKGVLVAGLSNGVYTFEVRSVSLAGASETVVIKDLFEIYVPGWLTWDKVLYILLALIIFIAVGSALGYRHYKRHFGKKVQEYLRQTISANPEYITQLDVYRTDEWELRREDLKMYDEIGRGTFGKVYLGEGLNLTSVCGVKFGRCAIKTIPECASNAERLHFLIEASVMKTFNTAYIVKLYGVVSEGQPVLVVMEMMDQGNLRDYLRARRPNSEENTNNAPLPTMISYFKWASQIADGMAYLESLKFCHRDLAARNCMVANDETVKIGDFGMARDIYYHEYYKPAGKRLMPVRWMAPESLKDGKFTVKSDVWSYGIVIYEMLTLGQQPYAGLGNDQVYNYIGVRRNILVRPVGCPDFWYDLMRICWKYDPRDRPAFYQILLYLKNTIDNSFKEFPPVREEGMKVFERSFVMTNFNDIEDEDYDFTYNEEEENARKHTMLQELERMQNDENMEYYKSGFGAPNNNGEGMDSDNLLGEDENGEKFKILTLQDLPASEKIPDNPQILSKKQIKERDKQREKFNKKQVELEKEWQKKDEEESKYVETIELKEQQLKAPLLKTSEKPQPPSPQLSPVAAHFREDDNYKSIGPSAASRGSKHRPPNTATNDISKAKSDYTEIHPLTKH
uniref:Receptor protein-tyrosine kinase n=1 Tax=Panagrolaimus sp. PS1159 TaxID=55785 RepID=A0AC35FXE4_9BILA